MTYAIVQGTLPRPVVHARGMRTIAGYRIILEPDGSYLLLRPDGSAIPLDPDEDFEDYLLAGSESDYASELGYDLPTLPLPIVQIALGLAASTVLYGHPLMVFRVPQVVNLTYPAKLFYQGQTFMENYPVNRSDFRLVRGVTNEILFYVRDIDRKPVTLGTSDSLTIYIVDIATDTLLMTRDLTVSDIAKGIYQLGTLPSEMDTWPTGPLRWSVMYNRNGKTSVLLWTDLSYSPYSHLYVTEGPIPGPAPTKIIAWSDLNLVSDSIYDPSLPDMYYSSSLAGAAQDGYVNGMQTVVANLTDFTGTVRIDGSLAAQPDPSHETPDWFVADFRNYVEFTGNDPIDVVGNYIWLRIVVTPVSGSVNQFSYKL